MRVAVALTLAGCAVAAACSKYGDEEVEDLPDRGTSSSSGKSSSGGTSGSGGDGTSSGGTSSGGTSGVVAPNDGGTISLPDGAPAPARFCSTIKNALRCLDFDDRPARPFGFDSFVGPDEGAQLTPAVNGNSSLRISAKLPTFGVFNSLPQNALPLTAELDISIESVTGSPSIVGIVGAGSNCSASAGSVALVASPIVGGVRFSITNVAGALGDAPLSTPVHLVLRSEPAPGPGKTINGTITMVLGEVKKSQGWTATIPIGCVNYSGAIGGSGVLATSFAVGTIDNVVLASK